MRKLISRRLSFALSCALALMVFASNSQAQTTTFTYQGSLVISGSVASGSYDLQFKLYDQLTGGSLQGSPNTVTVSGVAVTNGVFTVDLDFGASGFPGAARYLEISVRPASSGSFTTLSPRQQLTSTPYAIRSLNATSADTALNYSGSGAGITNLSASNISSGSLDDARLSSNVATLTGDQIFTGNKIFSGANGLLATGMFGSGSIPATGAGTRMMWYPGKAAFRAGYASGTQWDDASVGDYSIALGKDSTASGSSAIAIGEGNTAGNTGSGAFGYSNSVPGTYNYALGKSNAVNTNHNVAVGESNTLSGSYGYALGNSNNISSSTNSTAIGDLNTINGNNNYAFGKSNNVTGLNGVAIGESNTVNQTRGFAFGYSNRANASNSMALGSYASTNAKFGAIVLSDASTTSTFNASADNQFNARAAGGLRFFASSDTSDTTKPGLFISGTTGNTQINGDLTVSGSISGTINGGSYTNLNATNISSGTVADARLSSNVALLNSANTFTANQAVNANLTQSGTLVQFTPTDGFVAKGTFANGSIPATGAGTRMMWYPGKQAFRAGFVSGSEWDDANVGAASVAIGQSTTASGFNSVALGGSTMASGGNSVALGSNTTASGNNTTALGSYASTNGKIGGFVYGDNSTTSTVSATATNQFVVRAQNLWFGTDNSVTATSGRFLETSTGAYLTTGGTWTNSSSRALKTNFATINPRDVLNKVLQLPIQTWNYKAEDAKVRHIGAISQDFHGLFGLGDSAETISTVDADGVALAAIQGLHEELKDRDARIEWLEQQAKQQQAVIDGMRKLLCARNPQADVCQKQ